ncbi:MAG: hypothetical protein WAM25_05765, partial [Candidatus Acidiferrales bacterium]
MKRPAKSPKRRAATKRKNPAAAVSAPQELKPRVGLEGAIERVVPHQWTIAAYDPGLPAVLSTP